MPPSSSVARGLAWLAVLAGAVVGVRVWTAVLAEPSWVSATPPCTQPVEIADARGSRLGCASDPMLAHCPGLRAGDRVVATTCEVELRGMTAKMRLLARVPIDLNRATAADLELLDGIGPVLGQAIVAARDEAPFSSVDDLIRVRGVGPAKLARVRPWVTVGSP